MIPSLCWLVEDKQHKGVGASGGGRGWSVSDTLSLEPVKGEGTVKRTSMIIYDYDDRPHEIQLPDKDIKLLHVTILSGDETGYIEFEDGSTLEFDASICRCQDFYDGSYTVSGDGNIGKWMDWEPKTGCGSYERMDMMYKE